MWRDTQDMVEAHAQEESKICGLKKIFFSFFWSYIQHVKLFVIIIIRFKGRFTHFKQSQKHLLNTTKHLLNKKRRLKFY